jgi:hypothetical protein
VGDENSLVVAGTAAAGEWRTSPPLRIRAGERVVSFGPAAGTGLFVLLQAPSGQEALAVSQGEQGWRQLPPPPSGTATVAFAGTTVDALDAHGTALTVWALGRGHNWVKRQVIDVAIQYGSSS